MSETSTNDSQTKQTKFDFGPLIDLLKAAGFIGGGAGSITLLFFYIGNAIIVARLRVYDLYGSVHYTDEYVKEAGYQFFQDLFTFFTRWELGLVFILSLLLIFLLIPLGPFKRKEISEFNTVTSKREPPLRYGREALRIVKTFLAHAIRLNEIRYPLFAVLAVTTAVFLTSGIIVNNLTDKIIRQQMMLEEVNEKLQKNVLAFNPKNKNVSNGRERLFYNDLTNSINSDKTWIPDVLTIFVDAEELDLNESIEKFQKEFNIKENSVSPDQWEEFKKTETFHALSLIKLSQEIEQSLEEFVRGALKSIRIYLGGHLETDPEHIVISPGVYDRVNEDIKSMNRYVSNVEYFFEPNTPETRWIIDVLKDIEPIRFAGVTLSFAFWVLIGLLIYLLLNSIRIINFQRWEQVYFFFMALMFVIIAIAIPTIYGRYKFEFRVQKINGFELKQAPQSLFTGSIELLRNKQMGAGTMYTLGPTRGKEIIIASFPSKSQNGSAFEENYKQIEIMLFDKAAFTSMVLQPIPPEEIPTIIQQLRHRNVNQY